MRTAARDPARPPSTQKIDDFLRILGLDTDRHATLASFSKGMRQKVLLSAALLHNPRVVILDEPVSGLDVSTALVVRTIVKALAADGRIIFYSSHELDTVEKISTRVMILRSGQVVADDSAAEPAQADAPRVARGRLLAARGQRQRRGGRRRAAAAVQVVTGAREQVDALARAFFARFFESEITAGTDDLKQVVLLAAGGARHARHHASRC